MAPEHSRLLLVCDSLDLGGSERHVVDLAIALRRRGYAVSVACSGGGPLERVLASEGIAVHRLLARPVKRKISLPFAWRLRRLVQQQGYDLVHAHMYASAAAAALAAIGMDIPLIVTEHSEAAWRSRGARCVSRVVHLRAARVIAVSASVHRRLVEEEGVPPCRASLIPNAVPRTSFEQTRLPSASPGACIGVVARLQPEKGVGIFLEAVARLVDRVRSVRFLVIGDGPERRSLEAKAAELGIAGRVCFLGAREDARALMPSLAMLVVPSLSEGAPLVTLEAMSAGVPVIASAVGGIPEQIRDGVDGILVPPAEPQRLADAMFQLATDVPLAHWFGAAGPNRVAACFPYDEMVYRIQSIYCSVRSN